MAMPYLDTGRAEQKTRTFRALVTAARELVATGLTPTVEQAAGRAAISRTTAYRYFPNQRALLAAAHPETATPSLLPVDPSPDPAVRLEAVIDAFTRLVLDTEAQQRTMLRLSLDADGDEHPPLPLRQGRAIGWIHEALEPLRGQLTDQQLHQLVLAIRSAVGIEALTWLTDVGRLTREEAVTLMRWSARVLLHAARTAPPPTHAGRP